jgi:hypothetical protein
MSAARAQLGPSKKSSLLLYAGLWAAMSIGAHVGLFLLGFLGVLWFGDGAAGARGWGERDGDGFGGTSIEMEIAGPADDVPHGAPPSGSEVPPQEATQAAEPPPPPEAEPAEDMNGEIVIQTAEPVERPREREAEPAEETRPAIAAAPPGHDTPEVAAPGPTDDAAGTGADDSAAGVPAGDARELILGSAGALGDTISGQRALLPDLGACSDPIAGTWRSQKYRRGQWSRFDLHIERDGAALRGTLRSRIWTGSPADPRHAQCGAFGMDNTWVMQASGRIDGDSVSFGANGNARLIRQDCPAQGDGYAPDHFTGQVDGPRDTLQVRNNDGAYDIDEPYTFRRISCE